LQVRNCAYNRLDWSAVMELAMGQRADER
jgi:hypothetical protein